MFRQQAFACTVVGLAVPDPPEEATPGLFSQVLLDAHVATRVVAAVSPHSHDKGHSLLRTLVVHDEKGSVLALFELGPRVLQRGGAQEDRRLRA